MAPEPAAQIGSLDHQHELEVFNRAVRVFGETGEGEALRLADTAADRLVSIPARTLAELQEKVRAFGWVCPDLDIGDLAQPDERVRIAQSEGDGEKGLLAIYLDVAALAAPVEPDSTPTTEPSEFDKLRASYEAVNAAEVALFTRERETGVPLSNDELDRLVHIRTETLWATMLAPAPDAAALAWKLAKGIDVAYAEFTGESAEDPDTISRLLGEKAWDAGCIPAIAYQDALRLAGQHGPLTEAKPDPFDAEAFLAKVQETCGVKIGFNAAGATYQIGEDSRLEAAQILWEGLCRAHKHKVEAFVRGWPQ